MWALLLKLASLALGLFFPAKDERDTERQSGEELGAAKAGQAAAKGELDDIAKGDAARTATGNDADSILRDPANSGPARP